MPTAPHPAASVATLSAGVFSELTARAHAHPGPLYPLHVGDTWREPWPDATSPALPPLAFTYAPPRGTPALLGAITAQLARRSGRVLAPDVLTVVSGATSGVSVVCQTLLDPGDEVLLPAPFWPLVRGIIASRGARPVEVPLWDQLHTPGFDLEATLEAAITSKTVAIYLNSPNNPTGHIFTDDHALALARVAQRHNLWVICDEVYEELYFTSDPPPAIWARPDLFDRSVVVHSLSKAYAFAGGRIGYVHGPPAVMSALAAVQTHQVYCAPRPMQLIAERLLSGAEAWLAETRALYRAAAHATARAFGVSPPAGGTFLFVDASPWLPPDAPDAMPFLTRCLDEAGVLLTPGASSGAAYARHVRVCFTSVAPATLDAALARLAPLLTRSSPKHA